MADTYKILGQQAPAATTETDLYTAPAATVAILSTVVVCNRGATQTTFRLSVSFEGGATANKDYLAYDVPIPANDTIPFTLGVTMGPSDKLRCFAGNGNLSFNVFGVQKA